MIPSMIHRFLRHARVGGLSAPFVLWGLPATSVAEQVKIADELGRLAESHGFAVTGLEQTADAFGRADGEELFPRLRRLLEDFDHVIVQGSAGSVDRVIVLGEKVPFEPPPVPSAEPPSDVAATSDIIVQMQRRGAQRLVPVSLEGRGGNRVERQLQIDTGADYLVLPLSLLSPLGLEQRVLPEREMQTANGKVKARIGVLPSLWLGESRIANVATAFLEDEKLGSSGLLGMSVLGRYKLTIDDKENSITLGAKGTDGGETDGGGADESEALSGDPRRGIP